MKTNQTTPRTVDEYIADFPDEVQEILQKIRMAIKKAVPEAKEKISYKMPTFTLKGDGLICFAGYKKHVGIYGAPIRHAEFKEALSAYASGRSTVKFPLDQPIPFDVIRKIVKFRVKRVLEKPKLKR